ncbi:SOS response-associated peptidase [Luteibacter sp.]|uniref:SOS response-associated peptidase n=1 Tax=Luteibacter sp. TaxID=1886636 RepID=UPI0025C045FD|nr:SOS response-associated peptidase [Luteibacter sp.]
MCGRYAIYGPVSLNREAKAIVHQMDIDMWRMLDDRQQYNVCPTQAAPVVVYGEGGYHLRDYRWGLIPSWSKDAKAAAKMINARVETVADKPAYRAAYRKRRCLVPASGYYEWQGEPGNKQPYYIHAPDGGLIMMAGLWEGWRLTDGDPWVHTFTVLTGEPGRVSGDIHDRQPVILPPDLWQPWCEGSASDAGTVLAQVPEAQLAYHAVTKAVSNPRSQGPELIEPIG